MIQRDCHQQGIVQERDEFDAAGGLARWRDDREVEASSGDGGQEARAEAFAQWDAQVWGRGDRAGDERGHGCGERTDSQPFGLPCIQVFELLACVVEGREDGFGVLENETSRVRRLDAPCLAFEERASGGLLHQRDLARDGRLRVAEPFRRRGERPVPGRLADDAQSDHRELTHAYC